MIKADQVAVANASAPCLNPSLVERRLRKDPYRQLRRVDHARDNDCVRRPLDGGTWGQQLWRYFSAMRIRESHLNLHVHITSNHFCPFAIHC